MEKPSVNVGTNPSVIQNPDDVIEDLYRKLQGLNCLYRKPSDGNALYYFAQNQDPVLIGKNDFYGKIHDLVSFTFTPSTTSHSQPIPTAADKRLLEIAYYSSCRNYLYPFEMVVKEPAIIFRNGQPTLTPAGYDAASGIYYVENPNCDIQPLNSTKCLDYTFSGVPFKEPSYKANVIASLLGAVVLDRTFENPLVAVTGNQPGIGKTKLTAAMGYILTGSETPPVTSSQHNMNSEICTRFKDGSRFILIDNVTTQDPEGFRSDALSVHVTSGHSKTVRELHHNRNVAMRGVLFTLTANHCALHEDLAVRALMIKLHREIVGKMQPFVFEEAYNHRKELYGELLGLALNTEIPVVDSDYAPFFRFRSWLRFVAPRVEPVFGKLALEQGLELDPRLVMLAEWAFENANLNRGQVFTCGELLAWASDPASIGIYGFVQALHGKGRGKSKSLSTLLINMVNRTVSLEDDARITLRLADPGGPSKARRFRFDIEATTEVAA